MFFTRVANWQLASLIPVRFSADIVDTGGKFATGINNTRKAGGRICRRFCWNWWQICRRCHCYQWCTLTCEYLCKFSKKFETVLLEYSGAGGKLIHDKNQKQKISWHCPYKMGQCWRNLEKRGKISSLWRWGKITKWRRVAVPLPSVWWYLTTPSPRPTLRFFYVN